MKKLIITILIVLLYSVSYAVDNKITILNNGASVGETANGYVIIKVVCIDDFKYVVTYTTNFRGGSPSIVQMYEINRLGTVKTN